jgi:hypothetical protein
MQRVEVEMSSKPGFLKRSTALAAGLGFAVLITVAFPTGPALADSWKHHHHGHYEYDERGYVVVPGYVYPSYYLAPKIYYPPPPPYYPPPEVYYPSPPVYYNPPGLNFGINIPLQ